jgi:hypothetical protein
VVNSDRPELPESNVTTYFDTKQETCVEFCEECDRKTKHRRFNGVALFMCIEHVHPVSDRWPSKAHLEKPRRDFRDEDE